MDDKARGFKIELKGVIVPMLTPFKENGDLNVEALRMLTDRLIEQGVHGLFPVSSIGEAAKLSMEEKKTIIKTVVDAANGRVPVIAGTGFPDDRRTLQLTKFAQDSGADAALIVEPYYQKPSAEALYDYYKTINDHVKDFPLVLYNIPPFAGYELTPEFVAKCADLENIVAIKDSGGDMSKINFMLYLAGEKMAVLQGIDILLLPSLAIGSPGGMVGGANVAAKMEVEMYKTFIEGNLEKAKKIHNKLVPLWFVLGGYGTFPVAYKEAVTMMGIPMGPARKPVEQLKDEQKKKLKEILEECGLLLN
ncbi:MAG: 4-hydroxy-tetrahydrodipicolinate synthase [Nitrososphaerota archaeon]|nr:4-hydroxy-tetrahydrodipicolinate synthase [Candidatus Bathyarchaeota archaeon]MDW8023484.1 4-hydroxy-tetrahydrodipicolinate synthase [Nitrososphaerota archaeon]